MVAELTAGVIRTIQDAARKLTGAKRRKFQVQVAMDYCQGVACKAETILGWGRVTVQAGLEELRPADARQDRYGQRGRRQDRRGPRCTKSPCRSCILARFWA